MLINCIVEEQLIEKMWLNGEDLKKTVADGKFW